MALTSDQAFAEFRADFIGHLSERLQIPREAVLVWLRDYLIEPQVPAEPARAREPKSPVRA